MNLELAEALKHIETLITRPAESFVDPTQRIAEFIQRLERTRRLIEALDNPQNSLKTIHIGGTSGKGSIAIMCEAILLASGYHVGTHTSPYLQTPLEKIRVNGRFVSPKDTISLSERIIAAVTSIRDQHPFLGQPHYTEAWVAMALQHFADAGCEFGVIEVGMGGRYDATNILLPEVSVISTVHYDHVRVLGDTLAEIAQHKAGIIKPGVPTVVGNLLPEAMQVVEEEAARTGSRLIHVGREIRFQPDGVAASKGYFSYQGLKLNLADVEVGLTGPHQLENAATALGTIEVFAQTQNIQIEEVAIRRGLAGVRFAGRVEVVQHQPIVVLDGAHNEEKMAALVATLREVFEFKRLIVVLGMLEAKTATPIVEMLASIADEIITTAPTVKGKPALTGEELAHIVRETGARRVRVGGRPREAIEQALEEAGTDDLVVVTGSLYLIGEVRPRWYDENEIIAQGTMFPKNSLRP